MVWPTLGSRTAKEQNRTEHRIKNLVNFGPLTSEFTVIVWRPFMHQPNGRNHRNTFDSWDSHSTMDGRNRWMDLRQIHTEDLFGPLLGCVWMSRSKVKGQCYQGQKNALCTHNIPAVWTEWNTLVADNVAQAADATIRSLQRGIFAGLRAQGLTGYCWLCHITHF